MSANRSAAAAAVDLAWSLWGELGVPAPVRRHHGWIVVPEPLIVYTAALGDRDRRLRDNAVLWCVTHVSLVSARALMSTYTRERWGVGDVQDFAATMQQMAGVRWPGASVGTAFAVSAKTVGPMGRLDAPSQMGLRLRALLGVGARAEVIRVLLTTTRTEHTLSELAGAAMATKRQVADAVDQLSWAGVVTVDRRRQPYEVRLAARSELRRLVAPPPTTCPDWGPLLRLVFAAVAALEGTDELSEELAAAQLHRVLRDREDQLARLDLSPPPSRPATTYGPRVRAWLHDLVQSLAEGQRLAISG